MSFYLDDDDDFYASSNNKQEDEYFICENCGGTDSYVDGATGAHCCASCFTQSQTVVLASQDAAGPGESALEFEDVMGLAARTRGGRLVQQHLKGSRKSASNGKKRRRKPMEELDRTVELPDLLTCLWAFQRVLQRATICAVDLIVAGHTERGYTSDSLPETMPIRQNVMTTVQNIWNKYLAMWREGAEYYGRRHPEIRFSFRDGFFTPCQRSMLFRHLSHQAALRVRKELAQDDSDDDHEGEDEDESRSVSSSDSSSTASSESAGEHSTRINHIKSDKAVTKDLKNTAWGAARRLLKSYYPNAKGRKEAALYIRPSMALCASIIWLAVRHMGFTTSHIQSWIADGSLPLLNAFDTLLYPNPNKMRRRDAPTGDDDDDESIHEESDEDGEGGETDPVMATRRKTSLSLIANFFRMFGLPQVSYLDHIAKLLAFCTGVVSFKDISRPTLLDSDRRKSNHKKNTPCWDFDLVSSSALPTVTARMVADLGLSQQVLNLALAIMGRFPSMPSASTDSDHPTGTTEITDEVEPIPLLRPPTRALARAQNITTPTQVAAVVVVACKLCPGWETWSFTLKEKQPHRQRRHGQKTGPGETNQLIPWNDQELHFINNRFGMESYLDFVEDNLNAKDKGLVFPDFFDAFPANCTEDLTSEADWKNLNQTTQVASQMNASHVPVPQNDQVIAGNLNPNQPNIRKRHKHHEWYLTVKKPTAVWADVNGLGNYVVYRSMAKERYFVSKGGSRPPLPSFALETLHPHYVLLLEYVAYVTRLPIRRIHTFVTELDHEIHRNSLTKRQRRREKI